LGKCVLVNCVESTANHSHLWQIDFGNRFKNDNESKCKITIDGTDFRIYEQAPWNPKWYSHKFNGPAVRHEVGICIRSGEIVWINGPCPAGSWPDLRIARDWLIYALQDGEMVLADGGYHDGCGFFETPNGNNDGDQYMKALVRARHETINRRFKQWSILGSRYRHSLEKHGLVFRAIASITHFMMKEYNYTDQDPSSNIYGVNYKDNNSEIPLLHD